MKTSNEVNPLDEGILRLLAQEYEVSPIVVKEIITKYNSLGNRPSFVGYSHRDDRNADSICGICFNTAEYCKHNPNRGIMMFKGKDTLDNEDSLEYNTSIENTFIEEKENEMNTVISQLVEQNIIMGYNQGKTIQRMSQEFGLSAAEVSGVLKDNGLEVRRGPSSHGSKGTINADITAEIIKGYSEGLSVNSLAQKYSISPINITNTLKGNGVTMRPRGRSKGSFSGSRSTMDITTNVVEQAKRLYSMNNSLVETAKQLNINTMKLSQAFKDSGIILRRGRKPKAV
jgi:hypothetical protein